MSIQTTSSKLPMFNDTVTGIADPEFQISKKYPTIGYITSKANLTITGNISLVHNPAGGLDGDAVFSLQLDKPYANLVTTANYNSKMTGGIWVVLICQSLNNATALVHKGDCSTDTSPQFFPPTVGDRVKVTGAYVLDIREGGHAEIHPTFAMSRIS